MPEGWSAVDIGGATVQVFEPTGARGLPLGLLFLHDAPGLAPADLPGLTPLLQKYALRCAAPIAPGTWWVGQACPAVPGGSPERYVLDELVPALRGRWGLDGRSLGVAGVGMGGQGALRLAFRRPDVFPVAAGLGAAIDFYEAHGRGLVVDDLYDTRERARQDSATLHVGAHHWPPHIWFACDPVDDWHRGNDRLHEKLAAYGVPHACDLDTTADGDQAAYLARMTARMLEFLAAGLAQESRRLM